MHITTDPSDLPFSCCTTLTHYYLFTGCIQTWKDIKSTLKHKKEETDLTQLATHLLIEVGIHEQEKGKDPSSVSTINMVRENSNKSKFVKNMKRALVLSKGNLLIFPRNLRLVGVGFAKNQDITRRIVFSSRKRMLTRVRHLIVKIP